MSEKERVNADFRQAAIEHLDALYGFAMTLTRNEAEAQDLVQETYLRAVRAFGQLLPDSNLKGWLFAICRNIWLNQLRHARSGPRFVELDGEEEGRAEWLDSVASDPHVVFMRKMEREEVRAAIESLPRLYREVIVLRDL
ncbi:MAG TPA: sigma-70 family RNA polymerase sigma factor, partial [Blastocatellia bacterium]|nr:sigma-70 family RNA polymerase sigma factor [Blastocatellia bacterium]